MRPYLPIGDFGFRITHSHRLLSSSFLGLLHKSLNISHRKELLGSLVVRPTGLRVPGLRFPVCRLTLLFDKVGFLVKALAAGFHGCKGIL